MKMDFDLFSNPLFIIKKLQRNKIRKYGNLLKGRLLDVGCGTRPYQRFVDCQGYIGMDESLEVNPEVGGSILNLPFPDNSFDSIICSEVLEHLKEPPKALEEINRVLRPEGMVYITAPMSWCLHYEPDDYYRFTNHSLKYLIEKSGLELLEIERIGGIFSLIGVRLADVYSALIKKSLPFFSLKQAERIAAALTIPLSIFFYSLGLLLDRIDKRDALGWMALARKRDS